MSWYNSDYFDFGPNDATNTDRWAEWNVKLQHPGEYTVSAEGFYPNGHQWQFELLNSGASVYALPEAWGTGNQTETGENVWDLSSVAQGTYTLRAQNIMEWGQPKLKSITLQYNGDLPSDIGSVNQDASPAAKILQDGNLYILRGDRKYTVQGTEVE